MARIVVDEVVEVYDMDAKGYLSEVDKVKQANTQLASSHNKTFGSAAGVGGIAQGFERLKGSLGSLVSVAKTAAVGIGAVVAAVVAVGSNAFTQYAGFDSLVKALDAVEGSAEKAKLTLKDLQNLAKQPGLGFEESVQGYLGLRRSGISESFSKRLISETGNANALGGGSKESFARALLAFSQIAMKPFLQGEEVMQLNEAGIGASGMLKRRFGTADSEELKKRGIDSQMVLAAIVEEMSKLQRVGGGAQNTLDNFTDAIHFAWVNAGAGLASLGGAIDTFSTALSNLTEDNLFKNAMTSFVEALGLVAPSTEGVEDSIISLAGSLVGFGTFLGNLLESITDLWQMSPLKKIIDLFVGGEGQRNDFQKMYADYFGVSANESFQANARANREKRKTLGSVIAGDKAASEVGAQPGSESFSEAIPILRNIETNTNPLKELANQILGGGALAKNSFNRADLSDLRGGGGMTAHDRKLLQAIKEWSAVSNALTGQFSRREV